MVETVHFRPAIRERGWREERYAPPAFLPYGCSHTQPSAGLPPPRPLPTGQSGVFGKPLKESLKYASVQISTANANGELYVWGYIPVVVAKSCVLFTLTFAIISANARPPT